MVERYKFVGSGVTNSQGVAQLTHDANGNPLATPGYMGSGKGLTQMCASLDSPTVMSSGSDQSKTYIVDDTIAYDLCTDNSHSSQWSHSNPNEVTVDNTGMLINHNTTGLSTNTFKTPSASSNFCYTTPIRVEFDVVSITSQARIQFYDNTSLISLKLSEIGAVAGSHVKLVLDLNSLVCFAYVDDVLKIVRMTDTGNPLGDFTFRFRLEDMSSLKFKNLKINNTNSDSYLMYYDDASTDRNTNYSIQTGMSISYGNAKYTVQCGDTYRRLNLIVSNALLNRLKGKNVKFKCDLESSNQCGLIVYTNNTIQSSKTLSSGSATLESDIVTIPSDASSVKFELVGSLNKSFTFKNFIVYTV